MLRIKQFMLDFKQTFIDMRYDILEIILLIFACTTIPVIIAYYTGINIIFIFIMTMVTTDTAFSIIVSK